MMKNESVGSMKNNEKLRKNKQENARKCGKVMENDGK
jgi:hypothetical protein